MATFQATQNMRVQQHFEVLEIDLPVITGACTIGAVDGTGTPLTCDQSWSASGSEYKTYYFTNTHAPVLPSVNGEPIWRCIKSINETATELKPGDGLSSRSSMSIVFEDFTGQDPNIGAPGVTDIVKAQGTYFGKLDVRQIVENKNVRLKLYRVEPDGSIDLTNGAQTRNYLADTLSLNKNGEWVFACKDLLSLVNIGDKSWPITKGGFLRAGISNSTVSIPVDEFVDYSAVFAVRIGSEFLKVNSVSANLTSSAVLNVAARGSDINGPVSGVLLTTTIASSHNQNDEVFLCELSDDETIDSLLARMLTDSDLPASLIPSAAWASEVAEWHSTDKINTLHSKTEDLSVAINRLLTGYLMDLWFEPIGSTGFESGQVRLSAISVWKQSSQQLIEGKQINAGTVKKTAVEDLRATRALVLYDKRDLSNSDSTSSFKKGAQSSDSDLIGPDLFVKHKDKLFDNNFLLDRDAAVLLTQRYVSRFKYTPFERVWQTDERNLNFKSGDIVELITTADQDMFGNTSSSSRGQITKINPKYNNGRGYEVSALTYEAAFNNITEKVIDSPVSDLNIWNDIAGRPVEDVIYTIIFKGSYSRGDVAIRAGNFTPGSKLIFIFTDGFDAQASGGTGGNTGLNGTNGGIVYDAQGVDTDIYLSGATTSAAYPVADGYIRAPGGGGGGGATEPGGIDTPSYAGGGGGGGAGRSFGIGGQVIDPFQLGIAQSGVNGDIAGTGGAGGAGASSIAYPANGGGAGGNFGIDGLDGIDSTPIIGGVGGLAGSGIIDSGATVNLFGSTALRYINGHGDH